MNKKYATLDLTDCRTVQELHQRIKTALEFPEHYGENLDAFWDAISCDCDVNFVRLIGTKTIAPRLQDTLEKSLRLWKKQAILGRFQYALRF